ASGAAVGAAPPAASGKGVGSANFGAAVASAGAMAAAGADVGAAAAGAPAAGADVASNSVLRCDSCCAGAGATAAPPPAVGAPGTPLRPTKSTAKVSASNTEASVAPRRSQPNRRDGRGANAAGSSVKERGGG